MTSATKASRRRTVRTATWRMRSPILSATLACACACVSAQAAPADAWTLSGDIGAGMLATQGMAPGRRERISAVPYVYADFGPLFAREDTFGVKLLPLGWGSLELVGRISTEGADSAGPRTPSRRNPRPVGVGTFQETPWGGVFVDVFGDTVSGGSLVEASYAAQWDAGPVSFYPQVGVARRSARYVDHLYGVSAAQASATGERPYAARASTAPLLALSAEWTLAPHWAVVANVQRESFDRAIDDSPRVARSSRTTWLLALACHFD